MWERSSQNELDYKKERFVVFKGILILACAVGISVIFGIMPAGISITVALLLDIMIARAKKK